MMEREIVINSYLDGTMIINQQLHDQEDEDKDKAKFRLNYIRFRVQYFNITSSNNTFYMNEDGIIKTIKIDVGQYNLNQLDDQLQTKIRAASSFGIGYTVAYNTTTNLFTFGVPAAGGNRIIKFYGFQFYNIIGLPYESYMFLLQFSNVLTRTFV